MITIHQLILGSVLVAIIMFNQSHFRMPLIGLYFLICAFYYFSLQLNLGMYGLFIFLVLLMTGIIRNDVADEHEHFEDTSSVDADEEKGIEQFGIEDRFTTLHNLIHELSNKNSNKK